MTHPTAKMPERTTRNSPAEKTPVQLSDMYTNPESQNAQRHRLTDRRTDGRHDEPIADHSA